MKKDHKYFAKFSTALQIAVILFAIFAIVGIAAADVAPALNEALPEMPIILSGDIYVNGEKAAVGTAISVKLDGNEVGSTVLTSEGLYGDEIGNKLPITCKPEDCGDLEFYVNGEKVKVDPVIDTDEIDSDGFLTLRIDAEVSVEAAKSVVSTVSGGGMGGGFSGGASENSDGNISETAISDIVSEGSVEADEETAIASAHGKQSSLDTENSSTMLIAVCGLGALLIIGLIVSKSKGK